MNINTFLIQENTEHLSRYGLNKKEIELFFNPNATYEERLHHGLHIIKKVLRKHEKEEMTYHLFDLALIEPFYGNIDKNSRDHVIHSLQTYILGIYLNEFFLAPIEKNVKIFQWKLAGLFHDIGYPVKIGRDILSTYANQRNEIEIAHEFSRPKVFFEIRPVNFEILCNDQNSFILMQRCLDNWHLQIDIKSEFEKMIKEGSIHHGALSALSVLNIIDLYYEKLIPDRRNQINRRSNIPVNQHQINFENDIIPSCAAMFIHDLKSESFQEGKINRRYAPLAFLLKLSDCLQEWQRPCSDFPNGVPPERFSIEITQRKLIFSANVPKPRRERIKAEIFGCLDAADIEIY